MAKPIQHSVAAFLCGLIALGGSAIGYALKEGRTMPAAAGVAMAPAVNAHAALARAIGGCKANDLEACSRVAGRLEQLMAGNKGNAGDQTLAKLLSRGAVVMIRSEAAQVDNARWATVLSGLFSGDDAKLDASSDRVLARRIAGRLMSIAAEQNPVAANQ
jgi:hypothetical protein